MLQRCLRWRTKQASRSLYTSPTHPARAALCDLEKCLSSCRKEATENSEMKWKGNRSEEPFFEGTWIPESREPTFGVVRSRLRLPAGAAGELSQVQGRRAEGCRLNSPAWVVGQSPVYPGLTRGAGGGGTCSVGGRPGDNKSRWPLGERGQWPCGAGWVALAASRSGGLPPPAACTPSPLPIPARSSLSSGWET